MKNLEGLAKALGHRSFQEGGSDLDGALLAVDHINRLAWRYFVQNLPFEGQSVMHGVGKHDIGLQPGVLRIACGVRLV